MTNDQIQQLQAFAAGAAADNTHPTNLAQAVTVLAGAVLELARLVWPDQVATTDAHLVDATSEVVAGNSPAEGSSSGDASAQSTSTAATGDAATAPSQSVAPTSSAQTNPSPLNGASDATIIAPPAGAGSALDVVINSDYIGDFGKWILSSVMNDEGARKLLELDLMAVADKIEADPVATCAMLRHLASELAAAA